MFSAYALSIQFDRVVAIDIEDDNKQTNHRAARESLTAEHCKALEGLVGLLTVTLEIS